MSAKIWRATPRRHKRKDNKGREICVKVALKGFGNENGSALKILVPVDGLKGVKKVFLDTVKLADPNACPPMAIGVDIGGTTDEAALMAKYTAALTTQIAKSGS